MRKQIMALFTCTALALPFSSFADEVEHFEGRKSANLKEAVANFSEYNKKLEKILDGELTPEAMNEIHQLTYTLENALGVINEEFNGLAVTLEEVHLASESADIQGVTNYGETYLETSRTVIE
ncbi:DUF6746 family protein [Marinobacter orientalis]|uniref:Soluble cytochrome b562 n=1 Tax=Marinobacter orientalis TaxID=1928859 RepID=A0A7Y0RAF0_9GAMM|nr:DUF6746 family protein [Marinobacter orientalis]NMT62834.1 hypothetical protein [Marinobacter orientalis]TGX51511.1 hypothetical protein DIT72_05670 [Marinobacter orientalis]